MFCWSTSFLSNVFSSVVQWIFLYIYVYLYHKRLALSCVSVFTCSLSARPFFKSSSFASSTSFNQHLHLIARLVPSPIIETGRTPLGLCYPRVQRFQDMASKAPHSLLLTIIVCLIVRRFGLMWVRRANSHLGFGFSSEVSGGNGCRYKRVYSFVVVDAFLPIAALRTQHTYTDKATGSTTVDANIADCIHDCVC